MTTEQTPFQSKSPLVPIRRIFRQPKYSVRLHLSVPETTKGLPPLHKKMGLVLQHLMAHGHTTQVKGCRGKNRGWRRSPLGGGSGGAQRYLWWTPSSSPQIGRDRPSAENAIWVRAVRDHNDHTLLTVGDLQSDYYEPLTQPELEDEKEEFAGSPWEPEQCRFMEDLSPVRILLGQPGSGKSTTLWKAVERQSHQRVLYLTWSPELANHAQERFDTFTPSDVRVDTRDFTSFMSEICQADIDRSTSDTLLALFKNIVASIRLPRHVLGPWADRIDVLYAELHAILLGRAVPEMYDCVTTHGLTRLSDAAYRKLRGDSNGVGVKAADAALKIFAAIERKERLAEMFPVLSAATRSIARLQADVIPLAFADLQVIVVDEMQDLTLQECAVIVTLCRAIAYQSGAAPQLWMAGDEGQTVLPSGFLWEPTKDLLSRDLASPQKLTLQSNLRCPRRIARVIENASRRYGDLNKEYRPGKQIRPLDSQHFEAHLFYVAISRESDVRKLLHQLNETTNLAILSLTPTIPNWVPASQQNIVLTPAQAKGLEYQSVCVLGLGRLLQRLNLALAEKTTTETLEAQACRTMIDQMRVALSRATETLAVVDFIPSPEEQTLSLHLLDETVSYEPNDLIEHFANLDIPIEDKVRARTVEARALVDTAPRQAWKRICQAASWLGISESSDSVVDPTVCHEAQRTLLAIAARFLVDQAPSVSREDAIAKAQIAIAFLACDGYAEAFQLLTDWSVQRETPPFALLNAALALQHDWLENALIPVQQILCQALGQYADISDEAHYFAGDVEGWLRLTGQRRAIADTADRLRRQAVNTLLQAEQKKAAQKVMESMRSRELLYQMGKAFEAQERWEAALEAFRQAGANKDAHRVKKWMAAVDKKIKAAEPVKCQMDVNTVQFEQHNSNWHVLLPEIGSKRCLRIPVSSGEVEAIERELLGRPALRSFRNLDPVHLVTDIEVMINEAGAKCLEVAIEGMYNSGMARILTKITGHAKTSFFATKNSSSASNGMDDDLGIESTIGIGIALAVRMKVPVYGRADVLEQWESLQHIAENNCMTKVKLDTAVSALANGASLDEAAQLIGTTGRQLYAWSNMARTQQCEPLYKNYTIEAELARRLARVNGKRIAALIAIAKVRVFNTSEALEVLMVCPELNVPVSHIINSKPGIDEPSVVHGILLMNTEGKLGNSSILDSVALQKELDNARIQREIIGTLPPSKIDELYKGKNFRE